MDTQLKKGVLELCILYQLKDEDLYGYEIMKLIKEQFSDVYDGSIYAILRRLNADNRTEIYMKASQNGPPRKYYAITDTGREYLKVMQREWHEVLKGVKKLGIK